MGFPCGSEVKNPPANAGDTGSIPGEGNATHSSILTWEIPWIEPGGLQSTESQKVRRDLVTKQQQYDTE